MPSRGTVTSMLAALVALVGLTSAGQKPQVPVLSPSKPQLLVLPAVVGTSPAGSGQGGGQGGAQDGAQGVGPCAGRGMPAPCVITCTMSTRLCRACCAAVAALSTAPPVGTEAPNNDHLLWEMALNNATSCLSPCVRFTAKEVRKVLEKPEENVTDLNEMAKQLAAVSPEQDWVVLLKGPRLFSVCVDLNCL